ncbi:MAG: hypothetical protein HYZ14_03550 [Bacteroidetes bacterium]|nr:hypothetical protein [Bacteroidota bacterium]
MVLLFSPAVFSQAETEKTKDLLHQLELVDHDTSRARIYGLLAWEYRFINTALALDYADRELATGRQYYHPLLLADGYRIKALAYVIEEKIVAGLALYDSSLTYARQANSLAIEASCYSLIAGMYGDHGDFHKSIEYYSMGLEVAEKLQDPALIASLSNNLAEAFQSSGRNPELSQKYFLQALSNSMQIENWPLAGMNSANLAQDYINSGNRVLALQELKRAVDLVYRDTTNRYQFATNCHILASVYFDLDSLERAEFLALKSLSGMTELNRPANALRPLSTLTNLYVQKRDFSSARIYAARMLDFAEFQGAKLYIRDAYKALSEIARIEGDYKTALDYFEKYKVWNDSVFEVGREQSIANVELKAELARQELEIKYETEKKTVENQNLSDKNQNLVYTIVLVIFTGAAFLALTVLLYFSNQKKNRINAELQEQKKKVEQQAVEKGMLVHEIHHRVKNNLTMLKSLLYLQAKSAQDEFAQKILAETQARIQSMALVHQNLYEEGNNGRLDFVEFLESLFAELMTGFDRSDPEIEFKVSGTCDELTISQAIPLGLIMNELCTNSLKYAFQKVENPVIQVVLTQRANVLEIQYSDNGPGLGEAAAQGKGGFGFKLLQILTRQLDTRLVYTKTDQLSVFTLRLEIHP